MNPNRHDSKRLLPLAWIGTILMLVVLGAQLQGESSHFFGIADESEQNIRFSYPVEIVEVLVSEAAAVEAGAVLLRIHRPALDADLKQIDDQIRTALAIHRGGVGNLGAKLSEKIAERAAKLAELDVRIQALRSRRALNARLLQDLSGSPTGSSESSPLRAEFDALLEQRRYVDSSLNQEILGLRGQIAGNADPFEAELAELQDRKAELERQRDDLSVRASVAGRVGSINVIPGEQVAPFKSILTVHGESPRFVKGYIHENVDNKIAVNEVVSVQPIRPSQLVQGIEGTVESIGSRIVEYPERLNRNPRFPAWGREAVISLPQGGSLLMGEKVMISMQPRPWSERVAAIFSFGMTSVLASSPDSDSSRLIDDE